MPTVRELSAPYENYMLGPSRGPGVCRICFTFTDGYDLCYVCAHTEQQTDALSPISYSIAREQLHHELASYKRLTGDIARRLTAQLAAVLWRYLDLHERCVASAAGADHFALVATVPSGDPRRDEDHPLRRMVAELVGPTRDRHERILRRSRSQVESHTFNAEKYLPTRSLHGEPVLLIDDTWTTGASVQSAAAALKAAGAGPVGVVVLGRHVKRDWQDNDRRLRVLARPFDWGCCAREDTDRLN